VPLAHLIPGSEFLVNLVTSTKQTSLLAQASASLRVTDGVIILIDVIEGIRIQTEAVLRRALAERVKPLFIIIGIAQAVLDPQVKKEDLYQAFRRMVEDVNLIVSTYCGDDLSDWRACPEGGAVVFASGRHGWAFTLRTFAHTYAEGFGLDPETMMSHLWGEHFYDPRTKTWSTKPVDSEDMPLERAFNTLVLDPIYKIYSAVASSQKDQLSTVLEDLKIDLPLEEMCLEGDAPFKAAMHRFLPADKNLLETIVIHLPSPVSAQQYRVGALYEGPMDDESAVGIRTCDSNGPLVVCISKMMPIRNSDDGRFYAFGRVFSGTIKAGMHVRIQGPDYAPSTKKDVFTTTIAHHAMLMISSDVQPLEDCPAGNIIALAGIDQFLLKSGTLSSLETTHNMTPANSSTTPVVQCSVEVTDAVDLPKLVEGLKRLSRSEACVRTQVLESGAYVIAAVDEPDLEFCVVVQSRSYCGSVSVLTVT
jgi:elongation factor 2